MIIRSLAGRLWLLLVLFVLSAQAQKLPEKKNILAKMTLANAYFMQSWPDPGKEIVTNKTRPGNIWTRAV